MQPMEDQAILAKYKEQFQSEFNALFPKALPPLEQVGDEWLATDEAVWVPTEVPERVGGID
ncbi:hypothetical protein CROQUDRAFT_91755 [Cronartium quercuum f. sp. fusiforme G11]|uniref:Uncharacterized protein n=1 Tax=Cronartium quercuum f. sp. fusiforme G11 TaxID=708437 RepID=A0A9P6TDV4_9BASI|nr:hypothetical protein CROQUDRAFT_91755 [Cronartium quercuum f. sp. fusiforme G11]